jgi:hypothetical protein
MTRITVITSCTGEKALSPPNQLALTDFQLGDEHVREREAELPCIPAEQLYTGQQHLRLMRGVHAARARGVDVTIWIVSAGYGVVSGDRYLAPYEATFNTMSRTESTSWANALNIPLTVKRILAEPADYSFLLLGDRYMDACQLKTIDYVGAKTWALCGAASVKRLASAIQPVITLQSQTKTLRVGNIGLKGEVMARLLEQTKMDMEEAIHQIQVQ